MDVKWVDTSQQRELLLKSYKPCWPTLKWYEKILCILLSNKDDIIERDMRNNSQSSQNVYGNILVYDDDSKTWIPVICGHGGSMWLCRECGNKILKAK